MYFFDTYAIFEIINGNRAYEKYKEYPIVVSVLNIAELYAGLLREKGTRTIPARKIKRYVLTIFVILGKS